MHHFKAQNRMVMVNPPTAGVDYCVPLLGSKNPAVVRTNNGMCVAEFYTTVKTTYTLPQLKFNLCRFCVTGFSPTLGSLTSTGDYNEK